MELVMYLLQNRLQNKQKIFLIFVAELNSRL